MKMFKNMDPSQICVSSLLGGHATLCVIPILVYVPLTWAQDTSCELGPEQDNVL